MISKVISDTLAETAAQGLWHFGDDTEAWLQTKRTAYVSLWVSLFFVFKHTWKIELKETNSLASSFL